MFRNFILCILIAASCTPVRKLTEKAEEEHYALFKQRALIVYEVRSNKVFLVNPPMTRCYFLKGKHYADKWHEGDTMMIDSNLVDFYNLRFLTNH